MTMTVTSTHSPTATMTPIPTKTSTPEELGPDVPCEWAYVQAELNTPDLAPLPAGANFTKTWRIQNIGSCTWTPEYDLIFVDGYRMEAAATQSINAYVLPGQSVDVSVQMVAPAEAGIHTGYWKLRNAQGVIFGSGIDANSAFRARIEVIQARFDYVYDFALNICEAEWQSRTTVLPCVKSSSTHNGFVQLQTNPELEIGIEDELALWVHPNEERNGIISGRYPPTRIFSGDHFRSWIGCIQGYTGCNVIFELEYQIGSRNPVLLGSWQESLDGAITMIDIDLSSLSGETVQFTLRVRVNNNKPEKAHAFWFVPRIDDQPVMPTNTPTSTATVTATSTVTLTPTPTSTPSSTATPTPTIDIIPTDTSTPTDTPTATATSTSTSTPTPTP